MNRMDDEDEMFEEVEVDDEPPIESGKIYSIIFNIKYIYKNVYILIYLEQDFTFVSKFDSLR